MNTFNRVFLVILGLVWLVIWVAIALSALLAPQVLTNLANAFTNLLGRGLPVRLLIALIAGVLALGNLLLLILEVLPAEGGVPMAQVSGASATLTLGAIRQRIRYEVERLEHVLQAAPQVIPRGAAVDVRVSVRTDPEAPLLETTNAVAHVVREVVEQTLGLRLRRPPEIQVEPQPQPIRPTERVPLSAARSPSSPAQTGAPSPQPRSEQPQPEPARSSMPGAPTGNEPPPQPDTGPTERP
jgi:hypothetical protein